MFELSPVTETCFDGAGPDLHSFTVATTRPAAEVWAALHGPSPLHWCRSIAWVTWTSPYPFGPGTTRRVALTNGLRAREEYFVWRESPAEYVNAFSFVATNLPLFHRFGERYRVIPTGTGSEFTWQFYAEPRGPAPARRIAHLALARDVGRFRRDTEAHFS